MSIQRWDPGYEVMLMQDDHSPGGWVRYADHVAAINVFSQYLLADDEHSYAAGFRNATEEMRAACIFEVDNLCHDDPCDCEQCMALAQAMTAIRSIKGVQP